MIQNVIMAEEPSWGDDGKMEYWNDGILGRNDSDPSYFNALFHCSNTIHYSIVRIASGVPFSCSDP